MTTLTDLSLAEAKAGLRARKFSARELTQAHIAAIEAARSLNAFITETPERALDMAAAADERLGRDEGRALDGIPIAVKDLFCTKDVLTTAASHILDGFVRPTNRPLPKTVDRRRGHARENQSRRVRDGVVEYDEPLRPGREPVAPKS